MNEIALAGSMDLALSHLALVGAALICEDAGHEATFRWSEEQSPRPLLAVGGGTRELAEAVRAHAERQAEPGSWLMSDAPDLGIATFAVRSRWPEDEAWDGLFRARAEHGDPARQRWGELDGRLVASLGEPAWWRAREKASADGGASRWEMKTRNRGEEFFVHRLRPLAGEVAGWSTESVEAGLTGRQRHDVVGKDASESRTPTGLAAPGPVDNAVAWCALWGLAVMGLERRSRGFSESAGVWRRDVTHPTSAVLPVFTTPTTARWFSAVMASAALDRLLVDGDAGEVDTARLLEMGVRAIVRFPIHKGGSDSAPERHLQHGTTETLWTGTPSP